MDYSKLTDHELNQRISTIEIGLAVMSKFPDREKQDPRFGPRVEYYQGELEELKAELARRGSAPITIQAKTVSINWSQGSK